MLIKKDYSMKDYKKKYEESLEKAIKAIKNGKIYTGLFYDIFPELKESEDERIRKQTLKVLNYYKGEEKSEGRMPNEIEECISWLEKQGEQNPYSGISFKYNGHTWGMCARDGGVDILVDSKLKTHIDEKQEKQKVLTKDEEYALARIIEYLEDNDCPSEWKNLLNDIYSLKYQKPVEWSKEDEQRINDIMWCIAAYRENGFNEEHTQRADRAENWLKSLKPTNHWKPSEEQMESIKFFLNYHCFERKGVTCQWKEYDALETLYNDLQKL